MIGEDAGSPLSKCNLLADDTGASRAGGANALDLYGIGTNDGYDAWLTGQIAVGPSLSGKATTGICKSALVR